MKALPVISSPQLPLPVLGLLTLMFLVLLALMLRRAAGYSAIFLVVAVWLRVVSGAFNQITFAPIAGGLSINALLSVATIGAGIFLVPWKSFRERWTALIYALLGLIVVSGLYNRLPGGTIDMALKWAYLLVMVAAVRQSILDNGLERTLQYLALCYAPLLICQAASVGLGVSKQGELDGSASFIGGYKHEAVFSVMAMTFVIVIYFMSRLHFAVKAGLLLVGLASIFLANYRTTIIAALPLLVGFALLEGVSRLKPRQRAAAVMIAIPLLLVAAAALLSLPKAQERFADIGRVLVDFDTFLKPTSHFTRAEEQILSGRLVIWARYVNGYLDSNLVQRFIGLGPNSWVSVFPLYAHNTVVSFLYELGVFGVALLLMIWGRFIAATFAVRDGVLRHKILFAQVSFILLNMATMPHWQIEGNIMFAAIQGIVLAALSTQTAARPVAMPDAAVGEAAPPPRAARGAVGRRFAPPGRAPAPALR